VVPYITQCAFHTPVARTNIAPSFFWIINALGLEHADGDAAPWAALTATLTPVSHAEAQGLAVQPSIIHIINDEPRRGQCAGVEAAI
jgi:predicted outer membrane lipoprotein